jgi:transposase
MALTIVETRAITGGVDTHADTHVAAALDPIGGLLGVRELPATVAGYAGLLGWLGGFGTVCLAGIEGTGSYGAGLSRHVTAAGVRVVEVDRSDRQDRRRQGKSDPLDAVSAARAAQSGRARGAPKGRDGAVEAVRVLMVARRSARSERTQAINQARSLIVTGPDDLRARFSRPAGTNMLSYRRSLRQAQPSRLPARRHPDRDLIPRSDPAAPQSAQHGVRARKHVTRAGRSLYPGPAAPGSRNRREA